MARQILPIIGAGVGAVIGGGVGAQWGWVIGSVVGNIVDPQVVKGPSIGDIATQTSQEGVPRPIVYGLSQPISGNIVASADPTIKKKKQRSGKGGPTTETESVYRTYAIRICEGPIDTVYRIWRNGTLVYDTRPDSTIDPKQNQNFLKTARFFYGDYEQMPSPDLEAKFGAGNVPAMRGTAYMVQAEEDLTDVGGAIPQYVFQVYRGPLSSTYFISGGDSSGNPGRTYFSFTEGNFDLADTFFAQLGAPTGIQYIVFSKDGSLMISVIGNSNLEIYSGDSGSYQVIAQYPNAIPDRIVGMSISPDKNYIVIAGFQQSSTVFGTIHLWKRGSGNTWNEVQVIEGTDTSFLGNIKFSPDGRFVCSSVNPNTDWPALYKLNTETDKLDHIADYVNSAVPAGPGYSIAWSPDSSKVAFEANGLSLPFSRCVAVMQVSSSGWTRIDQGQMIVGNRFSPGTTDYGQIKWSASGDVIYALYGDSSFNQHIRAWDANNFTLLKQNDTPDNYNSVIMNLSGDGSFMAVDGPDPAGSTKAHWYIYSVAEENLTLLNIPTLLNTKIWVANGGGFSVNSDFFGAPAGGSTIKTWDLNDILKDICARAGMTEDMYEGSDVAGTSVRGYTITNQYPASNAIQELTQVFLFDPANYDGKINFIKRGHDAIRTITSDEFTYNVDGNNPAQVDQSSQNSDTIQIPQSLHLLYYDIDGGDTTDKQTSSRIASIRSVGEQTIQTAVILNADEAAHVVQINHKVMVEEQKAQLQYSLADSHIDLTVGDCVFTEYDGKVIRGRIGQVDINDGYQTYTIIRDRQSAYTSNLQGFPAGQPTPPPNRIVGATLIEPLDIHILADRDDSLGCYLAISGQSNAWRGATIDLSLDGGQNYIQSFDVTAEAIMGKLTNSFPSHPADWPDDSSEADVNVLTVGFELEDATDAQLQNGTNYAIIGNEVLQYGIADEDSSGTNYKLSHLLRGRNQSPVAAHAVGERFVQLDRDQLYYLPVDASFIGREITLRATSSGGDPTTDVTIVTFTYTGQSQVEYAPAYVDATQDAENLTVTWQGVGKLGDGTGVAMGAYFVNYHVEISDGTTTKTQDTTDQSWTVDITGMGTNLTISVSQRNSITGLGPATVLNYQAF